MVKKENLQVSQNPEIPSAPPLDVIRELKSQGFIPEQSPFWWSTDYSPDPREYVPFDEFKNRLVYLGRVKTKSVGIWSTDQAMQKDIYLYPNRPVPISILNLNVEGINLPFLVTARPYNRTEILSSPFPRFLYEHPRVEDLRELIENCGTVALYAHFYPHVRGLYAGRRGNNFFWYPLQPFRADSSPEDLLNGNENKELRNALNDNNLSFLDIYNYPMSEPYSYRGVWDELRKHPSLVDLKDGGRLKHVDFPYAEVSAEEFIEDYESDADLLVMYPLRLTQFETTLPLVVANKTHSASTIREPAILGVLADNENVGRSRHRGIARIIDRQFAQVLASAIGEDFGLNVDTVLFTPRKGRPKYERVTA